MVQVDYFYFQLDNFETEDRPLWVMSDLWASNRSYFKELRKRIKGFDNKESLFAHNKEKLDIFYEKMICILDSPSFDNVQKILKLRYEVYLLEYDNVLFHKLRFYTIKEWKNAVDKKYFTIFSTIEELESDIDFMVKKGRAAIVS